MRDPPWPVVAVLTLLLLLLAPLATAGPSVEARPPPSTLAAEEWQELPLSLKLQLARDCVVDQAAALLRPAEAPVDLMPLREHLRHQETPIHLIVPFGHPDTGRVALRYWIRNLRVNGGILDSVQLFVHSGDRDAMAAARQAARGLPGRVRVVRPPLTAGASRLYEAGDRLHWSWRLLNTSDALYIRVDDDLVFLEDGALEALAAEALLRRHSPPWLLLSGNVVNSYLSPFLHSRLGALATDTPFGFAGAYFRNASAFHTQHEQFLNRSLAGAPLRPYRFDGVWDLTACRFPAPLHGFEGSRDAYQGQPRWPLHFFAMHSRDLPPERPPGKHVPGSNFDEEAFLTAFRPATLRRPHGLVGTALAVHFGYGPQRGAVAPKAWQALLRQYDALAAQYCSVPLRSELT